MDNSSWRYAQDAIRVREGTTIYTDVPEIKTPANCIKINATESFPGNILATAKHAKNWLRSKRDIPCNRAGAYITEYNFRMFVANNESVGDSIMKANTNPYGPIFMYCMSSLAFLPPSLH